MDTSGIKLQERDAKSSCLRPHSLFIPSPKIHDSLHRARGSHPTATTSSYTWHALMADQSWRLRKHWESRKLKSVKVFFKNPHLNFLSFHYWQSFHNRAGRTSTKNSYCQCLWQPSLIVYLMYSLLSTLINRIPLSPRTMTWPAINHIPSHFWNEVSVWKQYRRISSMISAISHLFLLLDA